MKRLKISMFAVIAIVMGIAASAFTATKTVKASDHPTNTAWFRFMGDPTVLTQLQDNTEYSYVDGLPCTGKDVICAVNYSGVASSGDHPDSFSSSFKSRIANVYNGSTDAAISEEDN